MAAKTQMTVLSYSTSMGLSKGEATDEYRFWRASSLVILFHVDILGCSDCSCHTA